MIVPDNTGYSDEELHDILGDVGAIQMKNFLARSHLYIANKIHWLLM